MEWQVVEIKETGGKTVPFVSIGRGQLIFSAAACQLIGDDGNYKYAQLLTGKERNKTVVAVKFLNEYSENSIPIRRKQKDGKEIKGITIVNKGVISSLFGKDGSNDSMVRHGVELVDSDILKIVD